MAHSSSEPPSAAGSYSPGPWPGAATSPAALESQMPGRPGASGGAQLARRSLRASGGWDGAGSWAPVQARARARGHSAPRPHGSRVIVPRVAFAPRVRLCAARLGDEVDEFLHAPEEFRLEIGVAGHRTQDPMPRGGRVAAPAQLAQHALFPWHAAGNIRPPADPDRGRLDGLPDVDERMPGDQHVRRADGTGDPALLRAVHEMVDEHAEPPAWAGGEAGDDRRQVVDSLLVLDDDADVAQVVAPDLLHEFRVVASLDVDPARPRDSRTGTRRRHRSRGGPCRPARGLPAGRGGGRPYQRDDLALQQERRGAERENPAPAVPVLQRDSVLVAAGHGAAEAAFGILDDEPAHRLHPGDMAKPPAPPARPEHVASVLMAAHRQDLLFRHAIPVAPNAAVPPPNVADHASPAGNATPAVCHAPAAVCHAPAGGGSRPAGAGGAASMSPRRSGR